MLPEIVQSPRVLFDVRGTILGTSMRVLESVSSSILYKISMGAKSCEGSSIASNGSAGKSKSNSGRKGAEGTIFIDRNPKIFSQLLEVIKYETDSSSTGLTSMSLDDLLNALCNLTTTSPSETTQCAEEITTLLLAEARYFELPSKIIEALQQRQQRQQQKQETSLVRLSQSNESLEQKLRIELEEHTTLRTLIADNQLRSDGCYVSISEYPLAIRLGVLNSDLLPNVIQWSLERALQKQPTPSRTLLSSSSSSSNSSSNIANKNHLKPAGDNVATVILLSPVKTYLLAEANAFGIGGNVSNNNNNNPSLNKIRFELVSIGNNDIIVYCEGNLRYEQQVGEPKHFHRIVCRFIKDK